MSGDRHGVERDRREAGSQGRGDTLLGFLRPAAHGHSAETAAALCLVERRTLFIVDSFQNKLVGLSLPRHMSGHQLPQQDSKRVDLARLAELVVVLFRRLVRRRAHASMPLGGSKSALASACACPSDHAKGKKASMRW